MMDIDLIALDHESREYMLTHLMTDELLYCQRDGGIGEFKFWLLPPKTNQTKIEHHLLLGKKIMLIEASRSLMYEQLIHLGGRVECFTDMLEAVAYLDISELEDRPDLIVLNIGINDQLLNEQHADTSVTSLFNAAGNDPLVFVRPKIGLGAGRSELEVLASYRVASLVNKLAKLLGQKSPFLDSSDSRRQPKQSMYALDSSTLNKNIASDGKFVFDIVEIMDTKHADFELTDFEVNTSVLKCLIKDCSETACKDMIDIFIDESKQSVSKIHLACRQGDVVLVAMESHAIKSAARTFGCDSLHDLVSQLDKEAKQNNIDECHYLAIKLEHVFEKSRAQLENFKSNLTLKSEHLDGKLTEC